MAIAVLPYTQGHIPAVKEFNQRLARGGVGPEFRFPESPVPEWLPKVGSRRIFQQFFLLLEADVVRGGFILKQQDFWIRGEPHPVTFYHLPLSEGIVDKRYAGIGVRMLRRALELAPALYCLGMGGFDRPLPRMLQAMGWSLSAVPFHFRVHRPARFLKEIGTLREPTPRRWAARLAAASGLGWIGLKAAQALRSGSATRGLTAEAFSNFGTWADELWERARRAYPLIASRDAATLNLLYPAGKRFLGVKVLRQGELLGWAILLDTQMERHKYFGNLRLGSIADGLAAPENARAVIQAATRHLESRGVDLVISNHSHRAWSSGLRSNGFLEAPSNFIFAGSKPLLELLAFPALSPDELYFNRGDGDGPVNL